MQSAAQSTRSQDSIPPAWPTRGRSSPPWHGVAVEEPDGGIVTQYEAAIYQDFEEYTAVFLQGDEAPFYYTRRR